MDLRHTFLVYTLAPLSVVALWVYLFLKKRKKHNRYVMRDPDPSCKRQYPEQT